jgi:hypothetical protein
MMAEGDRLRGLEVREARHHGCRMFFGADQKGFDQALQAGESIRP